jgi:nucleoside-diphosphate-sugar epimerase
MSMPRLDYSSGLGGQARILVTGGSGFIGSNLVSAYRASGVPVASLDWRAPRKSEDADLWRQVDITQVDTLRTAVSEFEPTHVFHLAARTDLRGSQVADYAPNIDGVDTVLSVLAEQSPSIQRLVVTSSRMVCRIGYQPTSDRDYCPPNAYGQSKVETERIVRASRLPWVLTRPTSIWGPWFDVPYRDFFLNVARGRYVHPARRRILKSFGFVGNTTWQLHKLLVAPEGDVLGRTFYVADDPPIEVRDLADRISDELGRPGPRTVPLPVLVGLARAGDVIERTGRRAPLTSFRLENLLTTMIHDLSPLNRVAGVPPYDLEVGVALTVDWMSQQGLVLEREQVAS